MSKIIATLVATMFAATAFAQTNGTPPTQPAAGTPAKMEAKSTTTTSTEKADAKKAKRAARKAKRAEKVGDKPLN